MTFSLFFGMGGAGLDGRGWLTQMEICASPRRVHGDMVGRSIADAGATDEEALKANFFKGSQCLLEGCLIRKGLFVPKTASNLYVWTHEAGDRAGGVEECLIRNDDEVDCQSLCLVQAFQYWREDWSDVSCGRVDNAADKSKEHWCRIWVQVLRRDVAPRGSFGGS